MKKFSKKLGAIILILVLVLVIAPCAAIFAGCGVNLTGSDEEESSVEGEYVMYDYWWNESGSTREDQTLVEELSGENEGYAVYKVNDTRTEVTITEDSWSMISYYQGQEIVTVGTEIEGCDLYGYDYTTTWEKYGDLLILHLHCKEKEHDTEYFDVYFIGQIIGDELIINWASNDAEERPANAEERSANYEETKVLIDDFIANGCEKLYQYFEWCGIGG